jgi:hypothetical protein
MNMIISRRVRIVAISLGAVLASSSLGVAQNCQPLPANCQRANDRGMQFVTRIRSGGVGGIVDAASKQYCAMLVGIEINNLCAAEFRRAGNVACAHVLESQSNEYRRALSQAGAVASAASVRNARRKCTFE